MERRGTSRSPAGPDRPAPEPARGEHLRSIGCLVLVEQRAQGVERGGDVEVAIEEGVKEQAVAGRGEQCRGRGRRRAG